MSLVGYKDAYGDENMNKFESRNTATLRWFCLFHIHVKPPKKADDKTPLIFCLPYLGHYTLQVKTRLIRLIKQCYPELKLEVIFTSPKRISSLFRFKDKLPSLICSSVI